MYATTWDQFRFYAYPLGVILLWEVAYRNPSGEKHWKEGSLRNRAARGGGCGNFSLVGRGRTFFQEHMQYIGLYAKLFMLVSQPFGKGYCCLILKMRHLSLKRFVMAQGITARNNRIGIETEAGQTPQCGILSFQTPQWNQFWVVLTVSLGTWGGCDCQKQNMCVFQILFQMLRMCAQVAPRWQVMQKLHGRWVSPSGLSWEQTKAWGLQAGERGLCLMIKDGGQKTHPASHGAISQPSWDEIFMHFLLYSSCRHSWVHLNWRSLYWGETQEGSVLEGWEEECMY